MSKDTKQNSIHIIIIVAIAMSAGGFFAGMKYQQSKQPTLGRQGTNGARRTGFRPTSGQIVSSDTTSITVKLTDGSTKIVLLTDKTQINKASSGSKTDLTNGTQVAVFGTDNSDGSVTAQTVQINPQDFRMGDGKSPNQNPKSADATEIVVSGSNYKFDPTTIKVKKGQKTRIVFKDTQGMHDFVVDELNIRTTVIQTDQEDFVEFTPDNTGSFEFYCSVMTHRAMGMKGTIVVE